MENPYIKIVDQQKLELLTDKTKKICTILADGTLTDAEIISTLEMLKLDLMMNNGMIQITGEVWKDESHECTNFMFHKAKCAVIHKPGEKPCSHGLDICPRCNKKRY